VGKLKLDKLFSSLKTLTRALQFVAIDDWRSLSLFDLAIGLMSVF
jgi:hypothetical protein